MRETEHSAIAPLPNAPQPWLYLTDGPSALQEVLDSHSEESPRPHAPSHRLEADTQYRGVQRFALVLFSISLA